MVGRQVQMALAVLDDRDREALGQRGERRHRGAVAPEIGGDDQRVLRRREQPRRLVDRGRRRPPAADAATRRAGLS